MGGILKTFFRILLWTLLVVIVLGGLFLLCIMLELPRSTVIAGSALLLALLLLIVLVRRIFSRRRRRLQIQKIVTIDSAGIQSSSTNRVIDNRWNRAVSIMRESYLGRWGNPLYALPWYMIMGKTGAGKSSSVRHSGLNAMQTDVGPEDGVQSTSNCDWHFFREAVIMDTAGRYAVPLNETEDSSEWRKFLTRLARYRRKEPLNGLVIAVPADTLYGDGEHLLPEARCLRRRIDEIMRILGAKFPVYLMVTKLDLLSGMGQLLETLPENAKKQSVGIVLEAAEKKTLLPVNVRINNALKAMTERLKNFCLYSDNQTGASSGDAPSPYRILAWEEFRAMMPALRAYAEELFAQNPYQETPLLRGIFFSSALRDHQKESRAFPGLGSLARRILNIRESVGGVFLHDFFGRVLPADRCLHRPISEYLRWRSSVQAVAYGVMLLVTFGLSILFYLSYQHNVSLLHRMSHSENSFVGGGTARRLLDFERKFRDETQLEKEIGSGFLPDMGFNHATLAFYAYSDALCESFLDEVFKRALANLDEKRSHLTDNTDDKEFFILISDIVWRYDLLNAVQNGENFEQLLQIPAMPQGILQALGLGDAPQLAPATAYSVARSIYSIRDETEREQYLRTMRAALSQMPRIKSHSLQWIVHRAGMLSTLSPIRGEAFWSGARKGFMHEVTLDPVYTKEGLAVTLDYLNNLNLILDDEGLKPSTEEFMRWYATNYQQAWLDFSLAFAEKSFALADLPSRGELISLISSDHNPYFILLLRMDEELQAVRPYLNPVPPWLDDLSVFAQSLRFITRVSPENEKPTFVQRLKNSAQDIYSELNDAVDADARARDMKAQLLTKDIQAYLQSLQNLNSFTISDDQAFSAVKRAMPNENNPGAQDAPLTLAITATDTMNARLNPAYEQNSPVYVLSNGPMNFFMQRLMNGASCHIQAMWEGDVLAKAGRLAPSQLQQALFAEQGGIVRNFADNTLAYFLNRTLNGYEPEKLDGHPIPFTKDFLAFLNSGLSSYQPVRDEYGVTISALPADVNEGAAEMPYAVELSLHCARESQSLINYNSPASALFTWRHDVCGDTNLSVRFKSVSLDVLYPGENGFLNFLNDFQYGSRTFKAEDFPAQAAILDKLGVSDITLRYRITGAEELLSSHRFTPGVLPFIAVDCKQ